MSKKQNNHGQKKRWATKDVMAQIYEKKFWGGEAFDFYSGPGSHDPLIIGPYIKEIQKFLEALPVKPTLGDLGCGDFNVGRHLTSYVDAYIGMDIVPDLILRNQKQFQQSNLEFRCLDITKDDLPKVDCVLVRQVMQHLSNEEIRLLVEKLKTIPFVIVTEHLPNTIFEPNKDIVTGQGIRLKKNSGVDIMAPPFNLEAKIVKEINTVPYLKNQGRIVTTLYQNM